MQGQHAWSVAQRRALLCMALLVQLKLLSADHYVYRKYRNSLNNMTWDELLATPRSMPVLSTHNYTDWPLHVDQIPDYGDGSIWELCDCKRQGNGNEISTPFFLNTGGY